MQAEAVRRCCVVLVGVVSQTTTRGRRRARRFRARLQDEGQVYGGMSGEKMSNILRVSGDQ